MGSGQKFLSYIKWRLASLKTGFKVRQEGKFTEKAGEIDYKGQRLLLHSKLRSLSNIQVPLNNVAPEMLPSHSVLTLNSDT